MIYSGSASKSELDNVSTPLNSPQNHSGKNSELNNNSMECPTISPSGNERKSLESSKSNGTGTSPQDSQSTRIKEIQLGSETIKINLKGKKLQPTRANRNKLQASSSRQAKFGATIGESDLLGRPNNTESTNIQVTEGTKKQVSTTTPTTTIGIRR